MCFLEKAKLTIIIIMTMCAYALVNPAYSNCDCSNATLLGDEVQIQFAAPHPVINQHWTITKTVDMTVEARPMLGVELDISIDSITINFINPSGVSFPKNASFKFSNLNPQITNSCKPFISGAVITTSNQSNWVNTNSILTEDSIVIPVSPANSAFTWGVGSQIFIKFEFDCKPELVRLKHMNTGKCIYGLEEQNTWKAYNWICWPDPGMAFEKINIGSNNFKLRHEKSGLCLFTQGVDGSHVKLDNCSSNMGAMAFTLEPTSNGKFRLKTPSNHKCLYGNPSNGGPVNVWGCWNDPGMEFTFENH